MTTFPANPQDYVMPPALGSGLYYDPIYGYIPLAPQIRRAIDLISVQRLRRISQLSTVELVFPGATHNRLEHSVGVYHITTMIFETLRQKQEAALLRGEKFGPELLPAHLFSVQLAALFHDVGHGPYSHVFELFCLRNPSFMHLHHEKLTTQLIREGLGIYRDIPPFVNSLEKRLEKQNLPGAEFLTPDNISRIATGQSPSDDRYTFLSEIISNECVDADRIDYLLRDAQHCGIATGSTDVWQIIHGFTIAPEELPSGKIVWRLKISMAAAKAVEALLSARDLAYRTIYYHPTHRVAQEMMVIALYELTEKMETCQCEQLALRTDDELLAAFDEGSAFTKDVAQRIRFRRLYEPLPFRINLGRDLDKVTQARILGFSRPKSKDEYEARHEAEEKVARELDLPKHQRVIFDLEPTPITSPIAYNEPMLYDELSQCMACLMDELPHLKLTHGTVEFAGQKVDLHDRYLKDCSEMQIAVPFEVIADCVSEMKQALNKDTVIMQAESIIKEKSTASVKTKGRRKKAMPLVPEQQLLLQETVSDCALKICSERLLCIFDGLVSFLDLKDFHVIEQLRKRYLAGVKRLLISYYLEQAPEPIARQFSKPPKAVTEITEPSSSI